MKRRTNRFTEKRTYIELIHPFFRERRSREEVESRRCSFPSTALGLRSRVIPV